MGISSVNLMRSSVIFDVPSPSSSSSSSSPSSSRVHQTAENEGGEDRINTEIAEAEPSYRNRPCRKLGHHEVPRLILDDLENDNALNLEFEQLEREVLMLMLAKGLKGDKLEKFIEEKGIKGIKGIEVLKLNDKLKNLGVEMEEPKKCEKGKGVNHVHDKKLCEEIKLLESMLERGSYGLVDLQMMMEEVKGLEGSEKMASEIKMQMSELESEQCELKEAIIELKCKKSKELMMGCVKIEEENKGLKCEELEYKEEEEDNASKIKWGSIFASVGAVAIAAAAVFFVGPSKVEVKSGRRNKDQTG